MLKYYTNVFREKGNIFVRGRDVNGKREQKVIKYKPYLFVPSPKPSPYRNIQGQNVAKMDFESIWEAQQFVKKYDDVKNFSIYGFQRFEYNWIHDNFGKGVDFDPEKINVGFFDMEVLSRQGFPTPEKADCEITVISINKNGKTYVFSTKPYTPKSDSVTFFFCKSEKELLGKFLILWEKLDLDIITGWNIDGFDIPYLINRIINVFSIEEASRLSPWRKIRSKTGKNEFGKEITEWIIYGISSLDYLPVYKKFSLSKRDSYTLNNICYIELKEKKIDYSEYESLTDLWDNNPEKYIDYNIADTELVTRLEAKLKYIERAVVVAYDAKINYEDTLGAVLLWEVMIMNYLMNRHVAMPIAKGGNVRTKIEGAYVKPPLKGLFKWAVSFDLTSLYPHIIIGNNISPDTFVGKAQRSISLEDMINGRFETAEYVEKSVSITGNNCLYRTDVEGFLAALMAEQFEQRTAYKKRMIELKKQFEETKDIRLKNEITKYDNYQYGKKISLNSAYGALANPWFIFYDLDNAEGVTYTGQVIIRWAERKINEFLNTKFETSGIDFVIASDTDSLYLNLELLVARSGLTETAYIINYIDKFCEEEITPAFTKIFTELTTKMNCRVNALHMKREGIFEKVIWRAKKNYATYLWDQEGVRYKEPALKIVGLESVRSSTPEICRRKFEQAVLLMFTEGEAAVHNFINEFREEYMQLPIYDIGRPIAVNDYTYYLQPDGNYGPGSPINVKAAIIYNRYLKEKKLTDRYRICEDGDKIKYLMLKKFNPVGEDVIGAPDGKFPIELNIEEYVDKELMFEKTFLDPVKTMLASAGWDTENRSTLKDFFV